jgi:prepilin-type processing-associated H-X9-DG protein
LKLFRVMSNRWVIAVAVAIGGLLILLIPAFQAALEAGPRIQCQNNLRNVSLGLVGYRTVKNTFPCAAYPNKTLPVECRLSWLTSMSMYLDVSGLYNAFDRTTSWDSPGNFPLATIPMGVLQCPSVRGRPPAGQTQYVGITGVGPDSAWLPVGHPRAGVFGFDRETRLDDIKDGAETTLMLVETAERNGFWAAGGDPTVRPVDPARRPYIGRGRPFGGLHRGGANTCFADGSVRFLSETIDPKVFEALSTVAGGETLPEGWDR